jgi:uncharacterized protein YlxP (DUF503 family)
MRFLNFIYLYILVFFSFSLLGFNRQELISQIRPDRSVKWDYFRVSSNTTFQFNEYYSLAKDNVCAFVSLDFESRKDAIDTLLKVVNNKNHAKHQNIIKFIKNDRLLDNKTHLSIENYLNEIKNSTSMTSFNINIENDILINNSHYGIMDALALLKGYNLAIYQPLEPQNKSNRKLKLIHMYDNGSKKNIHLLYNGSHFNRLSLIGNRDENSRLQIKENQFLEETIKNIENQHYSEESSDFGSDFFSSEDDQPLLSLIEEDSVSKESYLRYVANFYIKKIPGFTEKESCSKAYKYFSGSNVENGLFAKARILIEKKCFSDADRNAKITQLIKDLDNLTTKTRSKEEHYKKIFQGKLKVSLGQYNDAYNIFMNLRNKNLNFTKTYLVDIAELIIVYDFIPQGMTLEQALEFAQTILNELPRLALRSSARNTGVLSSLHTSSVNTKKRTSSLQQGISNKNNTKHNPRYVPHKDTQKRISNINNTMILDDSSSSSEQEPEHQLEINNDFASSNDEDSMDEVVNDNVNNHNITPSFDLNSAPTLDLLRTFEEFSIEDFIRSQLIKIKGLKKQHKYEESHILTIELYEQYLKNHEKDYSSDILAQAYISLGNTKYTNGEVKNYVEWFNKAIEVIKDKPEYENLQTQAYIGLGNDKYTNDEVKNNAEWYNKARIILEKFPNANKSLLAQAYIGLGNARYTNDEVKNSAEWYIKALDVIKGKPGNENLQAQAYIGLGNASSNDNDRARWHNKALRLIKNKPGYENLQAQAYIGLGNARYTNDEVKNDVEWYIKALDVIKGKPGNENLQAQAYIGLGNVSSDNNDKAKMYNEALDVIKGKPGYENLQAQAYIGLGNVSSDNNDKAKMYNEALDVIKGKPGNENLQAQAYIGLGNARCKGDCSDWYNLAIEVIKDKPGYENLQAQAYIGLGNARCKGDCSDWYNLAIEVIKDKPGYENLQAQAYIGLGNARCKGDCSDWYNLAIEVIKDKPGYENLQAQAYIGLGNARCKGDCSDWYNLAIEVIKDKPGYENLQAQAYIGLGNARFTNHEVKNREEWYNKAVILLKDKKDNKDLLARAYIGLGNARYKGDSSDWYNLAIEVIKDKPGNENLRAQAYIGLGNARFINNKVKNSADWYNLAIEVIGSKLDNESLLAQAYIGLGNARFINNEVKNSADWYNLAIEVIGSKLDNESLLAQAYIGLGNALHKAEYYNKARIILEKLPNADKSLLAKAYQGLARNNFVLGDVNSRDKWYQKALSVLDKNNYLYRIIENEFNICINNIEGNKYGNNRNRSYNHKPYNRY